MNLRRQHKLGWVVVAAVLMWTTSAKPGFAGTMIKQERVSADCTHPEALQETATVAPVTLKPEEIARMSPELRARFLRVLQDGLDAWRQWIEVSTENLANLETTRTPEGKPYRRKEVVFQTVHRCKRGSSVVLVEAIRVLDPTPFVMRLEPAHPDAGKDGYVRYPNVDLEREVANIMAAARGYIANMEAIHIIKRLEVGIVNSDSMR